MNDHDPSAPVIIVAPTYRVALKYATYHRIPDWLHIADERVADRHEANCARLGVQIGGRVSVYPTVTRRKAKAA